MPAQAGIQFPCPRLLDSRFRGNDARIQVLAVYLRNGHLGKALWKGTYPLTADNVPRLLPSCLRGVRQPVIRSLLGFSTPPFPLFACSAYTVAAQHLDCQSTPFLRLSVVMPTAEPGQAALLSSSFANPFYWRERARPELGTDSYEATQVYDRPGTAPVARCLFHKYITSHKAWSRAKARPTEKGLGL
jgi:hypothetical protein